MSGKRQSIKKAKLAVQIISEQSSMFQSDDSELLLSNQEQEIDLRLNEPDMMKEFIQKSKTLKVSP